MATFGTSNMSANPDDERFPRPPGAPTNGTKMHPLLMAGVLLVTVVLAGFYGLWSSEIDEPDGWMTEIPLENEIYQTVGHHEPLQPLPATVNYDPEIAELGRRLFHDPKLSSNDRMSCATCHDFSRGGTDNQRFSETVSGNRAPVNTPTIFNSLFNIAQFWNGRAADLYDQLDGLMSARKAMGLNWSEIVEKLKKDESYETAFSALYPDGLTAANLRHAIVEYERTLITPNSRFDLYLQGQSDAITQREREGYGLFKTLGCVACHHGRNVGGNMFQVMGVMSDFFNSSEATKHDFGRYNVTGREQDRFVFRVPSLRNVELTAPYFHDGSALTLEEAVSQMAWHQLGRRLDRNETDLLVAFLNTLTGEQPRAVP